MSCEIELKYRLPEKINAEDVFSNPLVCKYMSAQPEVIEMQSTYFDTAENTLGRARTSIRIRLENNISIVTLKCSKASDGALSRRGEWEVAASSIKEAIPELLSLGAPKEILSNIEKLPLTVVAQFSFTRKTAVLQYEDFSAHLCVDIGYLSRDGVQKTPLHELELELISGSESSLRAMGALLCKTFSLCEERLSKLTRARNL